MLSIPLFKQDIKSNRILSIVTLIVMCFMCVVISFAMSMMDTNKVEDHTDEVQKIQERFSPYMSVLANYNLKTGSSLSYEDFKASANTEQYKNVFKTMGKQIDMDLSVEEFEDIINEIDSSNVPADTYIRQFEYAYALSQNKGSFTGNELTLEDITELTLELKGLDTDTIDDMTKMDTTAMINRMYYTVMGLLPIFLLVVLYSNNLLASQVDSGSMAYILSTPTKRSSIAVTQAVFMIIAPFMITTIVCAVKMGVNYKINGDANAYVTIITYLGMYLLTEAVASICYLGGCLFSQSRKAMAFGGGLTVWFFLASLLGMFGTKDFVDMGVGVEKLNIFNHLTLVGLYDIKAIATVGTDAVDNTFMWKFAALIIISITCYIIGAIRFQKKDLPL